MKKEQKEDNAILIDYISKNENGVIGTHSFGHCEVITMQVGDFDGGKFQKMLKSLHVTSMISIWQKPKESEKMSTISMKMENEKNYRIVEILLWRSKK